MKPGSKFKLLYSGIRDGWEIEDFHRVCDNYRPTLVLFKSSKGFRFGGFTTVRWKDSGESNDWKKDKESFIFSVDERELVFKPDKPSKAVCRGVNWGPNFGGQDLGICSSPMNRANAGECWITKWYGYHNLPCDSEGNHKLTGDGKGKDSKTFTCVALEVYIVWQ